MPLQQRCPRRSRLTYFVVCPYSMSPLLHVVPRRAFTPEFSRAAISRPHSWSQWRQFEAGEGALFVSPPSSRRLGDPTLDRAGYFALALSPGLFILAGRHALRAPGAAALYDS